MYPSSSYSVPTQPQPRFINPSQDGKNHSVSTVRNEPLDISDYLNLNIQHSLGIGTAGRVLKVFDHEVQKVQAIKLYQDQVYYNREQQIINNLPQGLPSIPNLNEDQQKVLSFLLKNQQTVVPQGYRFRNNLYIEGSQRLALIMDVYNVNLVQYLESVAENDFSLEERNYLAKVIFAKIFLCVYHLHQNGLIHCDISLDNFLVNIDTDEETLQIFINDFNHTKTVNDSIINHQGVSGKIFPPEIRITGGATCEILTPTQTIDAKRLDFFALFGCYMQLFNILKIPRENIDQDSQQIMLFFYSPYQNYVINSPQLIQLILNLEIDEVFMMFLFIDTYESPNDVCLKENCTKNIIDTLKSLQNDNHIFANIELKKYEELKEQELLQFDYQLKFNEKAYQIDNNNQIQEISKQKQKEVTILFDFKRYLLCFTPKQSENQIQDSQQWFERFKKLTLKAFGGKSGYDEVGITLNSQNN